MCKKTVNSRIVRGLAGSLGLLALAAPSIGQSVWDRPVEADAIDAGLSVLVTDAGQAGVAGTGSVSIALCDPNFPNDPNWPFCLRLSDVTFRYGPASGGGALKDPSAAEALGNGEVAIADTGNHRVLIVNQAGQITWNSASVTFSDRKLLRGPVDVQIIPDSTPSMTDNPILIACRDNNRIVVVKRTGQVLWAMNSGLSAPLKAERLPNGNTLIADSGNHRVLEVNAQRQIVATFDPGADAAIADAERLADGSTLVLDGGNGMLLQYMPNQPNPFIWDIPDWDLTGATDVDVVDTGDGRYEVLIATPVGLALLGLLVG